MKLDGDKDDWSLLPLASIRQVVKVLTYGAKKYDRDNWRKVDAQRYYAAFMRHFYAWYTGEVRDPESGLPHLAHCLTNLIFLYELTGGERE